MFETPTPTHRYFPVTVAFLGYVALAGGLAPSSR